MHLVIGSGETDQGDPRFSSAADVGMRDHAAIEVLGDPCSMLVLRDVIGNRCHSRGAAPWFGGGIASNILSSRVQRLAAGLLTREEATQGSAGGVLIDRSRHPDTPGHGRDGQRGLAHRDGSGPEPGRRRSDDAGARPITGPRRRRDRLRRLLLFLLDVLRAGADTVVRWPPPGNPQPQPEVLTPVRVPPPRWWCWVPLVTSLAACYCRDWPDW